MIVFLGILCETKGVLLVKSAVYPGLDRNSQDRFEGRWCAWNRSLRLTDHLLLQNAVEHPARCSCLFVISTFGRWLFDEQDYHVFFWLEFQMPQMAQKKHLGTPGVSLPKPPLVTAALEDDPPAVDLHGGSSIRSCCTQLGGWVHSYWILQISLIHPSSQRDVLVPFHIWSEMYSWIWRIKQPLTKNHPPFFVCLPCQRDMLLISSVFHCNLYK